MCAVEPVVRQRSQPSESGAHSESSSYLRSKTHGGRSRNALAYGSISTCSTCSRRTPATSSTTGGKSSASASSGRTCAAESRSHIAGMSPVITKTVPSSRTRTASFSRVRVARTANSIRPGGTSASASRVSSASSASTLESVVRRAGMTEAVGVGGDRLREPGRGRRGDEPEPARGRRVEPGHPVPRRLQADRAAHLPERHVVRPQRVSPGARDDTADAGVPEQRHACGAGAGEQRRRVVHAVDRPVPVAEGDGQPCDSRPQQLRLAGCPDRIELGRGQQHVVDRLRREASAR